MLELRPCDFQTARDFVRLNHRHNKPPAGHKFSIACYDGDRLCGVCMVGRPIGRYLDDGLTLEVNRCCTDGTRNRAAGADGKVNCVTCPLNYMHYGVDMPPMTCKAIMHYDRHRREWVEDE